MDYKNFIEELNSINSFRGKIDYANQHFTRIGSGSGRIVYDLDGVNVLKLALNSKGIGQNEVEAGIGYYPDVQHIVTKVIDSADNDSWIIAEKAKKVNERRIKELTGIPSLNDLFIFLKNYESNKLNGGRNSYRQSEELVQFFWNNEFAHDLADLIASYGVIAGDLGKPSSYGEVIRSGQPSIVVTDYGLNDEVYSSYYSGNKKAYVYENNDPIFEIKNNYINFVLNRKQYPKSPIPSMGSLIDCYCYCIDNLQNILNIVDKKKFYNNLVELQNYLHETKFYHRMIEDGSSKFSTDNNIGQDDFPTYNQDSVFEEITDDIVNNIKGNNINENTYKVYHGTNQVFDKFDLNKATQGIIWFTDSVDSIKKGEHGGQGNKYIMTRFITINNPAGWNEYEKYGLGQIENMGYDGIILSQGNYNDYIVFSPKQIRKVEPKNITENSKKWMPGAQAVEIKTKCKLGGLGNTSAACNQGDINNFKFKSINESKYSVTKNSLFRSKSISKEMKELISKYLTAGSTYHEGGRVHGLMKPKEFTEKTPKSSGVSLGADKNGFYCFTHRARCKSYELPEKIPVKDINYIESTG